MCDVIPKPSLLKLKLSLLVVFLGFSINLSAQDGPIRVDTDLVTVPVTVTDKDGRYITGLKKEDFLIFENGVEQETAHFEPVEQPFTVFVLLDVSDSMSNELKNVVNAANVFLKHLRPDDRLIAATFDDLVDVYIYDKTVREIRDNEKNTRFVVEPSRGDTMVYDAVDFAIGKMKKIRGRKAIVVFSDGKGTGRGNSAKSTLRVAEEQEAIIYTILYDTLALPLGYVLTDKAAERIKKRKETARWYMRQLAETTGGRCIAVDRVLDLDLAFEEIAQELGQLYSLGYYPKEPGKKGERRGIKVKVNVPNAAVRARSSYIVGSTKKLSPSKTN